MSNELKLTEAVIVLNCSGFPERPDKRKDGDEPGRDGAGGYAVRDLQLPQNHVWASFVGTLNQLECAVVDAAAGRLAYKGQSIATGSPVRVSHGATATLMLRPEELRLGTDGGENRLVGKVEAVNFLGFVVRVGVNLEGALLTLDLFNERKLELPKVGENYTTSFPPHACWVMEKV
jgi:putative spermidine/putrescine transport system ATP-binding protein